VSEQVPPFWQGFESQGEVICATTKKEPQEENEGTIEENGGVTRAQLQEDKANHKYCPVISHMNLVTGLLEEEEEEEEEEGATRATSDWRKSAERRRNAREKEKELKRRSRFSMTGQFRLGSSLEQKEVKATMVNLQYKPQVHRNQQIRQIENLVFSCSLPLPICLLTVHNIALLFAFLFSYDL
jgi:hypothetical protein